MQKTLIQRRFASLSKGLLISMLFIGCGKDSPPDHNSEPRRYIYEYGQKVNFGYGGDSFRFRLSGWSHIESTFTWTDGIGTSLAFRVPASTGPVRLRMRLAGFTKLPELPYQPVDIYVNAKKIGNWKVAEDNIYTVIIPKQYVAAPEDEHAGGGAGETPLGFTNAGKTRLLLIDFHIPKAASPFDLNVSWDTRRLGIQCSELQITQAPLQAAADAAAADASAVDALAAAAAADEQGLNESNDVTTENSYSFGKVVNFGAGGNAGRYKVSGWYTAEPGFSWTAKQPAVLAFKVPPADQPLTLRMKLAGMIKPGKLPAQLTELYVNHQKVADWQVSVPAEFSAVIPADIARGGGTLMIELHVPYATAPKALGVSSDVRVLGVRCEALVIGDGT